MTPTLDDLRAKLERARDERADDIRAAYEAGAAAVLSWLEMPTDDLGEGAYDYYASLPAPEALTTLLDQAARVEALDAALEHIDAVDWAYLHSVLLAAKRHKDDQETLNLAPGDQTTA